MNVLTVVSGMFKIALPMIEEFGLQEWTTLGLPALTGIAKSREVGKGQEELLIVVDALDKIMKFEATRKIA